MMKKREVKEVKDEKNKSEFFFTEGIEMGNHH